MPGTFSAACTKIYFVKSHGSPKCLGLSDSANCICYIMSCLNIAQHQRKLNYLWQAWRGQNFFHTFEKSLCGRKWPSWNCCIIVHMGGHFVCVCVCVCVRMCVCALVLQLCMCDLCEIVGSGVRNGPIGQPLQEAQHWHRLWVLGALDVLVLADDDRRTHFSGSLGKQQASNKVTIGRQRVPTYTGCLVTDLEPGFGKYSFSAWCTKESYFVCSVEQLSPLSPISVSVFYLQSPLINRTSLFTCALNIPFSSFYNS